MSSRICDTTKVGSKGCTRLGPMPRCPDPKEDSMTTTVAVAIASYIPICQVPQCATCRD